MTEFEKVKTKIKSNTRTWLITGVAGFIGSNILEILLKLDQRVVGLDNLSTGFEENLKEVRALVTPKQWLNFRFIKGDIRDIAICRDACKGVDYVLHHAAIGSVSRSVEDPVVVNQYNIDGFLNIIVAARDNNVKRFVYAASSSTYGDCKLQPNTEDNIGNPLSPYAVTKLVNELYAGVFARTYGFKTIGLRYFNIFGPRQDPNGDYAAVIPKWISAMIKNEDIYIYGDGETTRDFCYIDNVVQANILAATATQEDAIDQIYNIAVGERTSLNELYFYINKMLSEKFIYLKNSQPRYGEFRTGDIRHSMANIKKAKALLGYEPTHNTEQGINESLFWYVNKLHIATSS